ncbi:hypothetical protein ACFTXJ_14425 [Streptomyces zhihengii]|uniref:hypothetical protein n=1 Tax=Streptomyces zhihengii TaxID=1818004 RepID=UPI00362F8631
MTTYPKTRAGAKKAAKELRIGDTVWIVRATSGRVAPYEDEHLLDDYTVDHRQAFTGALMIAGSLSVEALVLRDGPVYTSRPEGLRAIREAAPQVCGPDPEEAAERAGLGRRAFARR